MWFRVDIRDDGSVAACQQVEAAEAQRVSTFYVEADSKASAIKLASGIWNERRKAREKIAAELRNKANEKLGLCRCGSKRADGFRQCESCREKQRRHNAERRAPGFVPSRRDKLNPEERIARERVAQKRSLSLPALRRILAAFDAMGAAAFRQWLCAEIVRREQMKVTKGEREAAIVELGIARKRVVLKRRGATGGGRPRTGTLEQRANGWRARVTTDAGKRKWLRIGPGHWSRAQAEKELGVLLVAMQATSQAAAE